MKIQLKIVTLLNRLNKISTNYEVFEQEIRFATVTAGLRSCLDEANISYKVMHSGLYIPVNQ
jgi:hypothetical protein